MNNGKICVSVCAQNAIEFIENIKRAAEIADIIELRFDCLNENQIKQTLFKVQNIPQTFLITFRPKEFGGNREISLSERHAFWQTVSLFKNATFFDVEPDLQARLTTFKSDSKIVSFHNFKTNSCKIEQIYEKLSATDSGVIKIAIQADEITDSLAVWKLLQKAKSDNRQLIPIAMGEAGKWTRILGSAHGAPLTFASLDTKNETAVGQITAQEMVDVYRVKELNEQTDIYGVVGNPVKHSLSPFMHNAAFKFRKLNAIYIPFEVKKLGAFIKKMVRLETRELDWNLKGFSVTIPHKQTIIKYLDEIDETARKVGAVNTVKIEDGKLYGYNTDADGFIEPLKTVFGNLQNVKVAVLGSGGAARAVIYALKKEGAIITVFARNEAKARFLAEEFSIQTEKFFNNNSAFSECDILVNSTPLGTNGELENQSPALASQLKSIKLVYDLVYNPTETNFIKEAQKANIPTIGGLAMLVAQGAKQFEIWTGNTAPVIEMSKAAFRKMQY
jgi:3-dehydroquinate dehydratase / shikimate dehydrogenase